MRDATLGALALALFAVLSCVSDRDATTEPPLSGMECVVPGSAIGADRVVVLIRNFRFLQDTIRVPRGTTVTWVNCEPATIEAHTVTSTADVWDSGLVEPGDTYARTFDATGTFGYFCRPHPTMLGAVIVN
jgi:plastocyanin